eukprot:COSAG06_NODE_6493_length_2910_cov_5.250089_3_plen_76_part_00
MWIREGGFEDVDAIALNQYAREREEALAENLLAAYREMSRPELGWYGLTHSDPRVDNMFWPVEGGEAGQRKTPLS